MSGARNVGRHGPEPSQAAALDVERGCGLQSAAVEDRGACGLYIAGGEAECPGSDLHHTAVVERHEEGGDAGAGRLGDGAVVVELRQDPVLAVVERAVVLDAEGGPRLVVEHGPDAAADDAGAGPG